MHVPEHFELTALRLRHEVMRAHPFALLVTTVDGAPFATHLPLELDAEQGELGTLLGHVSRANPHWRAFESPVEALAVFAGPHAYVSPGWYPEGRRVPTWNYVSVHAYGTPRLMTEGPALEALLARLVTRYEGPDGWSQDEQPAEFLEQLRRGVVGFEIPIARIEGKAKLGQNHSQAHRAGAIEGLRGAGGDLHVALADWMQRQIDGALDPDQALGPALDPGRAERLGRAPGSSS
jgi:transcriptional regulator